MGNTKKVIKNVPTPPIGPIHKKPSRHGPASSNAIKKGKKQ